jgi:hypothetical protein
MADYVYRLIIYYLHKEEIEEVLGYVDYSKRIVRLIDLEDSYRGFKEKGFINFEAIKKVEVMERQGCILKDDGSVC